MVDISDPSHRSSSLRFHRSAWLTATGFSVFAVMLDVALIFLVTIVTGTLFHLFAYDTYGDLARYMNMAFLVSIFYMLLNIWQKEYRISTYMHITSLFSKVFLNWNHANMLMLVVLFVTKSSDVPSRGSVILMYFTGLALLILLKHLLGFLVTYATKVGWVRSRRLLLVGDKSEMIKFQRKYQPWNYGISIVDTIPLSYAERADRDNDKCYQEDLKQAVQRARATSADDVFILMPWSEKKIISSIVDTFRSAPVAIHLGPEQLMEKYRGIQIEKTADMPSLLLIRPPLTLVDRVIKRSFDIIFSLLGLILLAVISPIITLLIWKEGKGQIFFQQKRGGFNKKPFYIYKFRTLKEVPEDGKEYDAQGLEIVKQVTSNDGRMTKTGNFLRKTNIDELPQLLNVLKGEMSLVGPRPHALQHDMQFQEQVAEYARRHNVKPGITGLAQVMGYRGETNTDEKIKNRVKYDLEYIDQWSLWKDIQIIFMTLFSPKARQNAK